MKRILFLGGGSLQTAPIIKAKELGYYTITCDYLPDNPGHKLADECHNVSTTDKEAVLALAKDLRIDGIVSYASDVSAPTAAYVAERLGLPTSPYKSVELLTHKDAFRNFLRENGFNSPKARGYSYSEIGKAEKDLAEFKLPVILKPTDASGSKGVRKINSVSELKPAVDDAMKYSRAKRFIIEEFIEKKGYQIAGDGFSVGGELKFRCFANEHFDSSGINPYVPVGESWPYVMPENIHTKLHREIQRVLTLLEMNTQAYNFDARIDEDENIWLMEIGPRNGGNLIPQVTKYATGIDMVEYTVKAAVGDDCTDLQMAAPSGFWSSYMIHSNTAGMLDSIEISDKLLKNNVVEYTPVFKHGDHIDAFIGANGLIGTMILKFETMEEMLEKMDHMERYIDVRLLKTGKLDGGGYASIVKFVPQRSARSNAA